jgi:hypothetical protein
MTEIDFRRVRTTSELFLRWLRYLRGAVIRKSSG